MRNRWLTLSRLPSASPRSRCSFLALSEITYHTVPWTQMLWALRTSTEQPGWPMLTTSFRLSQRASTPWWGRKECCCQVRHHAHTWFTPQQQHVFTSLCSFHWKRFSFGEGCCGHVVLIIKKKKKSKTVSERHHFLPVFYFPGGQKQRIAIARALLKVNTTRWFWKLIRSWTDQWDLGRGYVNFSFGSVLFSSVVSPQNPKILLLDEATRWLRNSFRIPWMKGFTAHQIVWTLSSVLWMLKMSYWYRKPWSIWWRVKNLKQLLFVLLWKDCVAHLFATSFIPKEEQWWSSLTACPPSRTLTLSLCWTSSM